MLINNLVGYPSPPSTPLEKTFMTPEQAAEKAAETLSQAADNAQIPDVAGAYVGIADGWTRLYTALAHTPPAEPARKPVTINVQPKRPDQPEVIMVSDPRMRA